MHDRSGEKLDGRYQLESLLGEGGMGQVYLAKHVVTGRMVAVKFLLTELSDNDEMIQRFYREAQAATAIGSEHICEVLDMSPPTDGENPYLVMEYLQGESLKERIAREKRIPIVEATNIMLQMLEALYAAHKAGIVHRDIKPENIFLVSKPEKPILVKLLDFGISKFNPLGGDDDHSLTKTGTVLGTPYYMSPEQASGDRSVGPLSDLYATGVILYEILAGKVPFDAESFSALVVKIVTHTPTHPCDLNADVPRGLGDLVMRAMARNAADRFESAKDMAEALQTVASGQSIPIQTMNAAEASFAAVALPSPSSGSFQTAGSGSFQAVPMTGFNAVAGSDSGSFSTSDPSMQTQTPMAMSRSVSGDSGGSKIWMIVGGVVGLMVLAAIGVAAVMLIPGLGVTENTVVASDPLPPPPPPEVLDPTKNAEVIPPVETPTEPVVNPEVAVTPDAGAAVTGDAAPEVVEPSKIQVTVNVEPRSATIFVNDEQIEGNPAQVELPADGSTVRVRAEADGHRDGTEEFTATEDREIRLALTRRRRTQPGHNSRPPREPTEPRPPTPSGGNNPVSGVVNPWAN